MGGQRHLRCLRQCKKTIYTALIIEGKLPDYLADVNEQAEEILIENKQYKHLLSLMGRDRDELNETLTERQAETLEKYDKTINEMHSLAEVEAFSYGFRLAVKLMIESGLHFRKNSNSTKAAGAIPPQPVYLLLFTRFSSYDIPHRYEFVYIGARLARIPVSFVA